MSWYLNLLVQGNPWSRVPVLKLSSVGTLGVPGGAQGAWRALGGGPEFQEAFQEFWASILHFS
jgi:hypothetical protein